MDHRPARRSKRLAAASLPYKAKESGHLATLRARQRDSLTQPAAEEVPWTGAGGKDRAGEDLRGWIWIEAGS